MFNYVSITIELHNDIVQTREQFSPQYASFGHERSRSEKSKNNLIASIKKKNKKPIQ